MDISAGVAPPTGSWFQNFFAVPRLRWVSELLVTGYLLVKLSLNHRFCTPADLRPIVYCSGPSMVLLSEIVQTFILADFCYYYVRSLVGGQMGASTSVWSSGGARVKLKGVHRFKRF
ncbi:hypothetical protein GUJ93_ZPchr0008g12816 [Zizania palustris]|uniref:Uncharacterized protein n=1 Tax=Zizania palustris TaxID=103762 RepID=A0A8J5VI23_ZIZPA|nr:hypothetical protein GUJ93_ZPchr0008g12816 [Zizania palustris]